MDNKTLLVMGATASLMSLTNLTYVNPVSLFEDTVENQTEADLYNAPVKYITESERLSFRLNDFLKLEKNWNGLGAIAPLQSTIENSKLIIDNLRDKHLKLLQLDDIVPSPYGTISLYFEDNENNELSIEIGKDSIGVCGDINDQEVIIDEIPINDFPIVLDIVNTLSIIA